MLKAYHFYLLNLVFISFFSCHLKAQQEVPIIVSNPNCEEQCATFTPQIGVIPIDVQYFWTFSLENGNTESQFSDQASFDWCVPLGWSTEGEIFVQLEVYLGDVADNQVIYTGSTYYSFQPEEIQITAMGTHETDCETDDFFVNSATEIPNCYDVCVGTTSTITIDNISANLGNGTFESINPSSVTWNAFNGEITGGGSTSVETEELTLDMDEVFAAQGEQVCIPVRVYDFDNIVGFQFSINFDPNSLDFISVQNFNPNLLGWTVGSIGTSIPGALTVTWGDPLASGVSLADESILIELCFEVIGTETTYLNFSGMPISIEFISANEVGFFPDLLIGAVIIDTSNVDTFNFNSITVLWEEEGSGIITFSGLFDVNSTGSADCQGFYEYEFCFNVIPPPPSEIATAPPLDDNGTLVVCEGQTIFFSSHTTDAVSYTWDFGDGTGASSQNPTHNYTNAGTYEVQLITAAECDCADTSSVTVFVEGNDVPFVDCVATICEGTAATYTATSVCSQYNWMISSNGTILEGGAENDNFITVQWNAGPIGEITLETNTCSDLSDCTAAAYLQIPIISATTSIDGPSRVCQGEEAVYTLPPFEGVEFNWQVSTFGTITSGQGTSSITVEWSDGPIPTSAQLVSVDYNNCYLECGGNASLNVLIRPEFYVEGAIEVCQNTMTAYTTVNTQTNAGFLANFTLTDGDGTEVWTSPSATETASVDWSFPAGIYTLLISPQMITDFCTTSYEIPVKIVAATNPPSSIIGQQTICPGLNYTYSAENAVEGERYEWSINNGSETSTRLGEAIVINWGDSPPYFISLTRSTPPLFCASSSVFFNAESVTDFSIQGDPVVCFNEIIAYTTDVTGDLQYQWSISPPIAGSIIGDPSSESIEVLWHFSGDATINLDICGQQETLIVHVNDLPEPIVNAPNEICPNTTINVTTLDTYEHYQWLGPDDFTSDLPNPVLNAGYYHVEVVDDLGCMGESSFDMNTHPQSSVHISTPNITRFCDSPPVVEIFADDTDQGYIYQWYQDGVPIIGEDNNTYTTNDFGTYDVAIIDINNCTVQSNSIEVVEDCGGTGTGGGGGSGGNGGGGGGSCPNVSFSIQPTDNCQQRNYMANTGQSMPTSILWDFDDPDNPTNTASGSVVSHQYNTSGFHLVTMMAFYEQIGCFYASSDTVMAIANFDFNNDCAGSVIEFQDISTFLPQITEITSWEWNFDDPASGIENTSIDQNPIHEFTTAGDYNVELRITTTTGCSYTVQKTVTVFQLPVFTFEEPASVCANTPLAFSINTASNLFSVEWDFGDPASMNGNTSNLDNTYHTFANTASFNVSLQATDNNGCMNTFSRTIETSTNDLIGEIDPSGFLTLCDRDTILLQAVADSAIQWNWTTGAQTQSITVGETANYSVVLTDENGCSYSPEPTTVDIIAAPQSPIRAVEYNAFNQPGNVIYDTLYICYGDEVFLEMENQADFSYRWSNGDMDNATEFSADRDNLLSEGTHTISASITDDLTGCSAVEVFVVIVNPTPAVPILNSDNTILCSGTNHTISVQNTNNSLDYFWTNGEHGHSITTNEAGMYKVTAFNDLGCKAESEALEILSGPNVSLVPSGCHTRCAPDTICLPIIPGIVQYQWYQDGMPLSPNGDQPTLIIDQSGVYTLEMVDVDGCVLISDPLTADILEGFGTIIGTVYLDQNGNQLIDPEDEVAPNVLIDLQTNNSTVLNNDTDESGVYGFANIPATDYVLNLDTLSVPEGWQALITSIDTSVVGCDEAFFIDWLLVPACFDTLFTTSVCPGDSFSFHGQNYPAGDQYTVQTGTLFNCDSTFVFSVEENPSSFENLTIGLCVGESNFIYNDQMYGVGTDTLITLTNSFGCDSTIQLIVLENEVAVLELSTEASCPNIANGALIIDPLSGSFPFEYAINNDDFQATSIYENLDAGSYDLNVEDNNGCLYTEAFEIEERPQLLVSIEDTVLPCDQTSIQLSPMIISGDDGQLQFSWSDGLASQERPVSTYAPLSLQVSNACEQQSFNIEILPNLDAKRPSFYLPNVFSPNNDGYNDTFKAAISNDVQIESFQFQLFDRWGGFVFETQQFNNGWKGDIRGQIAQEGVYVWLLEANLNFCGKTIKIRDQGDVLLVR